MIALGTGRRKEGKITETKYPSNALVKIAMSGKREYKNHADLTYSQPQ